MTDSTRANLVRLADTDLTLASPEEDIRGRTVIDNAGEDSGEVKDLLIDDAEGKVRFLQVGSGGFLGIGEDTTLVPVDAITRIDDDHVHVNFDRTRVSGGPKYDPDLAQQPDYWDTAYGYYGYAPYWAPGYVYPAYPLYGR